MISRALPLALALLASSAAAADDAELSRALTNVFAVELAKSPALEVLARADLQRVLELEADKASAGCDDDSCLAEVAAALGARFVVFGELARVGTSWLLTATLYDSEQGRSPGRVVRRADTEQALLDAVPGAVGELVGPTVFGLPQGTKARLLVLDIRPPAPAPPPPPPAAAAKPAGFPWWLVVVGAGAASITAGGVYDVVTPTSNNEQFDGEDLVGAGLVGAGVVAAGAGVVLWLASPGEGG